MMAYEDRGADCCCEQSGWGWLGRGFGVLVVLYALWEFTLGRIF
jgi:hypothetical protein